MVGHVKAIVRVGQELKRWEIREWRMVAWSEMAHVARHVAAATLGRGNRRSATLLCNRWDEVGRGGALGKRAELAEA